MHPADEIKRQLVAGYDVYDHVREDDYKKMVIRFLVKKKVHPRRRKSWLRVCARRTVISICTAQTYAAILIYIPVPSNTQHLSYHGRLDDKTEDDYQNCSVLYSVMQLCTIIIALIRAVLTVELGHWSRFFCVFLACFFLN